MTLILYCRPLNSSSCILLSFKVLSWICFCGKVHLLTFRLVVCNNEAVSLAYLGTSKPHLQGSDLAESSQSSHTGRWVQLDLIYSYESVGAQVLLLGFTFAPGILMVLGMRSQIPARQSKSASHSRSRDSQYCYRNPFFSHSTNAANALYKFPCNDVNQEDEGLHSYKKGMLGGRAPTHTYTHTVFTVFPSPWFHACCQETILVNKARTQKIIKNLDESLIDARLWFDARLWLQVQQKQICSGSLRPGHRHTAQTLRKQHPLVSAVHHSRFLDLLKTVSKLLPFRALQKAWEAVIPSEHDPL